MLCICQRVACPTKKEPLSERAVDFMKLLGAPSYPGVLWELVLEEEPPVTGHLRSPSQ